MRLWPKIGFAHPGGPVLDDDNPRRSGAGKGAPAKAAEAPVPFMTPPIESSVTSILTPYERLPRPAWATFAGSSIGVWRGSFVSFNPYDGTLEPIALTKENKPVMVGDSAGWPAGSLVPPARSR